MALTTITGVGSGFDIDSWVSQLVSARQVSTVTPLEQKLSTLNSKSSAVSDLETKFKTLKSSLESFTNTLYGYSGDMWTNTSITSSNDSYATATSSGRVASGDINIQIEQIATATTAKSANSLGSVTKENIESTLYKNIANGQTKAGTFSLFLDGKETKIEISENDSLGSILEQIKTKSNNRISYEINSNGSLTLKALKEDGSEYQEGDKGGVLSLGSSGDTSNFASALKLYANGDNSHEFTSAYPVSTVNADVKINTGNSGLNDIEFNGENNTGTITINGVDFSVSDNMSINDLISKINGNSDVNVQASYDSLTNKFVLTSSQTGQCNISLSESNTNLLEKLGLTQAVYNENGEKIDEILADGSQTLGKNAICYINNNKVISTSNTITGEASGISNLSVTIKKETAGVWNNDNTDAAKNVTLSVAPDYTKIKESLQKFVDAYNDVVTTTKSAITSNGSIGNDSSLSNILSSIRSVTSMISDNDGSLSLLSEIGISTSNTDATKLSISSSKLDKALQENFDSVQKLLSDGYSEKEDNGIFDRLLSTVNDALNADRGYFKQKSDSLSSQIKTMNTRIERANTQLSNYQIRIQNQFNQMDTLINSLNSQLSTFQSYFG